MVLMSNLNKKKRNPNFSCHELTLKKDMMPMSLLPVWKLVFVEVNSYFVGNTFVEPHFQEAL